MDVWLYHTTLGWISYVNLQAAHELAEKRPDVIFFFAALDTSGVV